MQVTPFGREVKRLRAESGLTVRDLAQRLDKSVAYVGKIESQGEVPSPEVIHHLAVIFDVDVESLIDLAKEALFSDFERDIERKYAVTASLAPKSGGGNLKLKGVNMAKIISLIN